MYNKLTETQQKFPQTKKKHNSELNVDCTTPKWLHLKMRQEYGFMWLLWEYTLKCFITSTIYSPSKSRHLSRTFYRIVSSFQATGCSKIGYPGNICKISSIIKLELSFQVKYLELKYFSKKIKTVNAHKPLCHL